MSLLPETDRILLGPGPSLTSPRVMRAMAAPTVSHLDPLMLRCWTTCARSSMRTFQRADGLVRVCGVRHRHVGHGNAPSRTWCRKARGATVVVTGYFGDRLAQMCERYGATRDARSTSSGGARAIRTRCARAAAGDAGGRVVAMVHAETSTGVLQSGSQSWPRSRAKHGALTIVDAVTSFGGHPLDVGAWGIDACYSCTQKCLGGPSGLRAGRLRSARARAARQVPQLLLRSRAARGLLAPPEYHHTMSSTLVYALVRGARDRRRRGSTRAGPGTSATIDALRRRRCARSACRCCRAKASGCGRSNAVRVPDGVDEAARAQAAARRIQHRDRRRPRSARRQDLARRPDGSQLVAAAHRPAARRTAKTLPGRHLVTSDVTCVRATVVRSVASVAARWRSLLRLLSG